MKKSLNLIPFILIALFYLFVRENEGLSFLVKMVVLAAIILVSSYMFWQKMKNQRIDKNRIGLLLLFIIIAVGSYCIQ